jgi:hypothetical protein
MLKYNSYKLTSINGDTKKELHNHVNINFIALISYFIYKSCKKI